jgi:hypothetical protein
MFRIAYRCYLKWIVLFNIIESIVHTSFRELSMDIVFKTLHVLARSDAHSSQWCILNVCLFMDRRSKSTCRHIDNDRISIQVNEFNRILSML